MTTAAGQPRRQSAVAGWVIATRHSVRHTMDRPLTSYYLLLGASTLLLTIGLLMVLSSSSVESYKKFDTSYHYFFKQLMWVGLALPAAFIASRLPHRALRKL
ncbi:MAG TPA: FtsW/RodA/SpoVE family cell cycle protein, partial [Nocardioidaceae bacterium]|nr:FtsW/RodA/SpoVE family cell cycle protein [Nocardioidaceae bacterium]